MNKLDFYLSKIFNDFLCSDKYVKNYNKDTYITIFGKHFEFDVSNDFLKSNIVHYENKDIVHNILWNISAYGKEYKNIPYNIKYFIDNDIKHKYRNIIYDVYRKDKLTEYNESLKNTKLKILNQKEFEKKICNDSFYTEKYGFLGLTYKKQLLDFGGFYEMVEMKDEKSLKNSNISIIDKKEWKNIYFKGVNQLDNIIDILITEPNSNKIVIDMLNIKDTDEELLSIDTNNIQFSATVIDLEERYKYCMEHVEKSELDAYVDKILTDDEKNKEMLRNPIKLIKILDHFNVPERKLSIMVNKNSSNILTDLSFDITYYNIFLNMICQIVGMLPNKIIFNIGELYCYEYQEQTILELLEKNNDSIQYKLKLNTTIQDIYEFRENDIIIE